MGSWGPDYSTTFALCAGRKAIFTKSFRKKKNRNEKKLKNRRKLRKKLIRSPNR